MVYKSYRLNPYQKSAEGAFFNPADQEYSITIHNQSNVPMYVYIFGEKLNTGFFAFNDYYRIFERILRPNDKIHLRRRFGGGYRIHTQIHSLLKNVKWENKEVKIKSANRFKKLFMKNKYQKYIAGSKGSVTYEVIC